MSRRISDSTVRRLSQYLQVLEELERSGSETVSSGVLAELGGTTAAQVRKDLSQFGSFGKRGMGYNVADRAVAVGIKGILNFAAVALRVPAHVPATNVNLVMELEALSFAVTRVGHGV